MNDIAKNYLPWIMSAMTIYMTFLQGNKNATGWIVGLVNQFLWLAFAVGTQTWGLLPLNAALWILYTRNFMKWRKPVLHPLQSRGYCMSESGLGTYKLVMGFESLKDLQDAQDYVAKLPRTPSKSGSAT